MNNGFAIIKCQEAAGVEVKEVNWKVESRIQDVMASRGIYKEWKKMNSEKQQELIQRVEAGEDVYKVVDEFRNTLKPSWR